MEVARMEEVDRERESGEVGGEAWALPWESSSISKDFECDDVELAFTLPSTTILVSGFLYFIVNNMIKLSEIIK